MNLNKITVEKLIELSTKFLLHRDARIRMIKSKNNFFRYIKFLKNTSSDDKEIILCTVINYIQQGLYDESLNFIFEKDSDVDEFLITISDKLLSRGVATGLLPIAKGERKRKTIKNLLEYIDVSIKCRDYFESSTIARGLNHHVVDFTTIVTSLDDIQKAELLALTMYGSTEGLWDEVLNKAKKQIHHDFADKLALTDNLPNKIGFGYQKYLKCQN